MIFTRPGMTTQPLMQRKLDADAAASRPAGAAEPITAQCPSNASQATIFRKARDGQLLFPGQMRRN